MMLRTYLCVRQTVVHADEWRADVGLLVQVCEPEAAKSRRVVEDRGVVFGGEAVRETVPRLG